MPNWTGNRLTIIGLIEDISLFESDRLATLMTNDYDPEQVITFNMVLPMPKELKGTISPRPRTEEQIRQDAKDYGWPEEVLQDHLARCLLPEDAARLDELKAKYGADNWYDWCNLNWGTKWDACHATIERVPGVRHAVPTDSGIEGDLLCEQVPYVYAGPQSKDRIEMSFDTAWVAPEPVIHALVRKYPNLNFIHSYFYEGEEDTNYTVDYRMNEGVLEAMINIETDMTEYEPWEDVSHLVF